MVHSSSTASHTAAQEINQELAASVINKPEYKELCETLSLFSQVHHLNASGKDQLASLVSLAMMIAVSKPEGKAS